MEYFINLKLNTKERFDMSKFLEYSDNHDPLTSSFLKDLKALEGQGKYVVQSEEGRPDVVSFKIFKNIQYWWMILYYNDLSDVDDLVPGTVLSYPSIEDLEDLYFSLKSKQKSK